LLESLALVVERFRHDAQVGCTEVNDVDVRGVSLARQPQAPKRLGGVLRGVGVAALEPFDDRGEVVGNRGQTDLLSVVAHAHHD
jgi:hypothetical protein